MLPEERRTQLDNIVSQMVTNKESDEAIQFVVNDFKTKYSQSAQPKKGLLEKTTDVVNTIFPGKQLGTSIGNSLTGLHGLITGDMQKFNDAGQANSKLVGKVAGDIANIGLTVAAPGVGRGATALGRIGANAALGAGIGASNAISQGEGNGNIAKDAAIGGVTSGAFSSVAELATGLTKQLPNRLVQRILPKLKDDNIDYALKNTKLGGIAKLTSESEKSVSDLGRHVDTLLRHSDYVSNLGEGNASIQKTLEAFPESEFTPDIIISKVKGLVGDKAGLVQKVANGKATIYEKNLLRKALDKATASVYGDNPKVTTNKLIGSTFADMLRKEVQTTAPETAPLFEKMSKEINLRNALRAANRRIQRNLPVSLYDLGIGTVAGGGPAGIAAAGVAKVARLPGVNLAASKGLKSAAPLVAGAKTIGQGLAAPVLNSEQEYLNQLGL